MMSCVVHKWSVGFVMLLLVLVGRGEDVWAQAPEAGIITDFRVPEFDPNGVLKSEIFGEQAEPLLDDKIRITGLRIVMYKNRAVESTLTSSHCTIDRKDRSAFSNAEVKIIRGNVVVTGKGFRWDSANQRIEILNNFHMVMTGKTKMWPLVKEKK